MMKKTKIVGIISVLMLLLSLAPIALAAPTWTQVGTFAQLKTAVENKTDTHIQLTANIQMDKTGIVINPEKTELVIDGNGHTLTVASANTITSAMYMKTYGKLKDITIQNMNINGPNSYGLITIVDSTKYSDVTVTFDNIEYTGPGLSWGRKSNFVIRDSNLLMVPSSLSECHEVFECLTIRLEGNVNIVKDAPNSTYELFWITGGTGGVTVAANAHVNVISNQGLTKKGSSGFVYYSCPDLHLIFEDDSYFNYVGNNIFQECSSVDRLIVGERAEVYITLYGELYCTYGIFAIRGEANIGKDAILELYSFNNNQYQPILQLTGTGSINFNSPKTVFIYNSSTKSGNTALALGPNGCDVTINYNNVQSIEYWKLNKAAYNNLPAATYLWFNPSGSQFSASERVSGSTVKSATTSNYVGTTPWNTVTAAVKDINVVSINGENGKVYAVNFNVNGGSPQINTQYIRSGALAQKPVDPVKNGYAFDGWYTNPAFTGAPWNFVANTVSNNITLYAKWTTVNFSIDYVLQGGTNAPNNPVTYNIENLSSLNIASATLMGFTLLHWTVICENGTQFNLFTTASIPEGTYGNLTLFAVWDPTPILYSIEYDLDGGVNAPGNPVEYAVTSIFTINIDNPTKAGYVFFGWIAIYENGTVTPATISYSIPANSACNVLLRAVWVPESYVSYNIVYTLNGGVNAISNPSSYVAPVLPITLANPTRAGYVLSYWVMSCDNGSMIALKNGVIPNGTTGDITLTAVWSVAPTYTITYTLNGGVNAVGNPTLYSASDVPIAIANPSMTGYTFSHWLVNYADGSLGVLPTSGIPANTTGNITLIAVWI